MDYVLVSVVAGFICFVGGVIFSKHVISEADSLKNHVTEAVAGTETRLRAEIADIRSKIASKFREG